MRAPAGVLRALVIVLYSALFYSPAVQVVFAMVVDFSQRDIIPQDQPDITDGILSLNLHTTNKIYSSLVFA